MWRVMPSITKSGTIWQAKGTFLIEIVLPCVVVFLAAMACFCHLQNLMSMWRNQMGMLLYQMTFGNCYRQIQNLEKSLNKFLTFKEFRFRWNLNKNNLKTNCVNEQIQLISEIHINQNEIWQLFYTEGKF